MDKTSLKKALLEVKEIETFAAKSAKKLMEQEFLPQVEKSVRQALLEMEQNFKAKTAAKKINQINVSHSRRRETKFNDI